MTSLSTVPVLARSEGYAPVGALEAIVKGALESELHVGAIAAPRRAPFDALPRLVADEASQRLLQRHALEIVLAADAARAVGIATRQVRNGRCGIAIVPNELVPAALSGLAAQLPMPRGADAALVLAVEDNPQTTPGLDPRRLLVGLGIPSIEPATVSELRDAIESGARLAKAGGVPVAIVVDASLLRSSDTIEARANRVVDTVDVTAVLRRMRRGPRPSESGDLLRLARRLELNRLVGLPSPGEREPLGMICVGPAFVSAAYLLNELRLTGRVPLLKLGLTSPIDESAVLRILQRCEAVLVVESRVGSCAASILEAAESLRRRGERIASLWWREAPPVEGESDAEREQARLADGDAVRPSLLARRTIRLLHALRPGLQVAARLATVPPALERIAPPPRGESLGTAAAMAEVRSILVDVDQTLRSATPDPDDPEARSTALAIDGVQPAGEWDRVVLAEVWDRRRFAVEGIGAVRQAARGGPPRVAVLPDVGGDEDLDLERLASAAIPADAARQTTIRVADLNDRAALRELLREAVLAEQVTIVIARDGPPARRDPTAVERLLAETDRLGFTPKQRLVWPADVACELRPPSTERLIERGVARGAEELESAWTVEPLEGAVRARARITAKPLFEQVEIIRTRPPTPVARGGGGERIAPPRLLHAGQGMWRAHLAGWRGEAPGLAALVLADAGRAMGYRVQTAHQPAPVGPGRRAWAQVLFSRLLDEGARGDASTAELLSILPAEIPYGEADLVVGADGVEALRALGPDPTLRVGASERTGAVVNIGPLDDQFDEASVEACRRLPEAVRLATLADRQLVEDFAVICRGRFLTDRVLDLMLLGVAFQLGTIPVTVEAMEGALRRLEARGYGRAFDVFAFGRRVAVERPLRERGPRADEDDEAMRDARGERLLRRILLEIRSSGWRGRRQAAAFGTIARQALAALSGFDATPEGQAARRDFLMGLHRCLSWGGFRLARRYADLIRSLHAADRGENAHELTRMAVRPIAEAILIRDLLHLAAMATSLEHRRRTRDRLAVRRARGDMLERRYLNRIEAIAFGRRYRLDVRTSDWPARLLALVAPFVPERFRGGKEEQEIRAYVTGLAERAIRGASDHPQVWLETFRRLAEACDATAGFREISARELRLRVEGFDG